MKRPSPWLMAALACVALMSTVLALGKPGWGQEAVAEDAAVESEPTDAAAGATPLLSAEELELLVSRIAFYPDEVIAVTLPAATYPLDIVQAARLLEQSKAKPDLQPSDTWDASVIALLNYPVVIAMMNDDLDWTTSLGEAVLDQQADVIDAIQQVRRGAYTAGFLKSDDKNTVTVEEDAIEIVPADPKVVYVPVYEPAPAPEQAIVEEGAPEGTTVVEGSTTEITNNYYPQDMSYSEPYTPYYNEAASFWTGALVGGLTMGFLMDWDDDDIDIDFDSDDFDDWSPGRGDVNIDGDVNIGNDVEIGNGVRVDKGDSWRKARDQKVANNSVSQLNTKRPKSAAARPAASQQPARAKAAKTGQVKTGQAKTGQAGNKKQLQAKQPKAAKVKTPESRKAAQKPSAVGKVERGQNTVKASNRGANSQQRATNRPTSRPQAATQNRPGGNQKAARSGGKKNSSFGNMSSGKKAKQSSKRGGSSQRVRTRR